jgi:acyl carrier protein
MNDPLTQLVLTAVANHLRVDVRSIHLDAHLAGDLGLDALDLILIVLRLDEITSTEIAIADLEGIESVRDLRDVVRVWMRVERNSLEAEPVSSTPSGVQPIAQIDTHEAHAAPFRFRSWR